MNQCPYITKHLRNWYRSPYKFIKEKYLISTPSLFNYSHRIKIKQESNLIVKLDAAQALMKKLRAAGDATCAIDVTVWCSHSTPRSTFYRGYFFIFIHHKPIILLKQSLSPGWNFAHRALVFNSSPVFLLPCSRAFITRGGSKILNCLPLLWDYIKFVGAQIGSAA